MDKQTKRKIFYNKLYTEIRKPMDKQTPSQTKQDNIFWNSTIVGKEIQQSIQDLTQEYWESGFEVGKQTKKR
jgi:hypothetical protein